MCFTDFKLTVDRFPLRVEIKGAYRHLEATTFVISSNFKPQEWWSPEVTAGTESAIFRRITEVYHFTDLGRFIHYPSYSSWAHDFNTPRDANHPFQIQAQEQTFELQE